MYQTVGTCSICGGEVVGPQMWHGILPPPMQCSRCGAIPAQHGKVIDMVPQKQYDITYTSTTDTDPNKYKPTTTSGSNICI